MMKRVSIVMAVYRPNVKFFIQQLQSIDNQDYKNLNVFIRDDSANPNISKEIEEIVCKTLKNKEYKLIKNDINLGSTKTFELLTKDADGDYIAYSDQDDIWRDDKVTKLVQKLENENSNLVYSDLEIIDKDNKLIAKSFRDIRKRLKHESGDNLFGKLILKNSVTGCTMLIKKEIAIESIPFNTLYVHDHWLAINASINGRISYVDDGLIQYRIHENNQIGSSKMIGINSKKDYIRERLDIELERYNLILKNKKIYEYNSQYIKDMSLLVRNRINMIENKSIKSFIMYWNNKNNDIQLFLFETALAILPEKLSAKFIKLLKNTKL